MARPGAVVTVRDTPTVVTLPTDTGTAFIAGLSDTGASTFTRAIHSLQEFVTVYGQRQTYSVLYDSVEAFFREGGNLAYIGRVVGPGATSGFKNLLDAGAAVSLIATAVGPGAWSANYKVAVVAGVGAGTFKIQVTDTNNVVLEDSGDLLTQSAAVQWSQQSNYIRITLGASANNPAVAAAAALSAGNDDRGNITDAQWLAALNLFSADLGPGQVLAPGRITTTGHTQLRDHAEANNRVALLDAPDTPTVATLTADAATFKSRFSAYFAPWLQIPPVTVGGNRTIPPSPVVAGIIARNDNSLGPNRPSAGGAGVSRLAVDISQPSWSDTNRQTLNASGVNVIRRMFGGIRIYGWRSLADPVSDINWLGFGNGRLHTAIAAQLGVVGENFMFDEIDGQNGETIGGFHDAIAGIMMDFYNSNQLFGDTPDAAFAVDTSPAVNTLTLIQNNELHAVVTYKAATMAEYVQIEVVKRLVTLSL